jgi:hypothetical protein
MTEKVDPVFHKDSTWTRGFEIYEPGWYFRVEEYLGGPYPEEEMARVEHRRYLFEIEKYGN